MVWSESSLLGMIRRRLSQIRMLGVEKADRFHVAELTVDVHAVAEADRLRERDDDAGEQVGDGRLRREADGDADDPRRDEHALGQSVERLDVDDPEDKPRRR